MVGCRIAKVYVAHCAAGADIMELGIDFNQFTYFQLRRFFSRDFSRVYDRIDIVNALGFRQPTGIRDFPEAGPTFLTS
jgi:hypothetical protein